VKTEPAFRDLSFPNRQAKPRDRGITMMIDWGLPRLQQAGVTETAGTFINLAKIAGSIVELMPKEIIKQKLANYESANISTSQRGLFTEYAFLEGKIELFFQEVAELGFSAVIVSDNLLNWSLKESVKPFAWRRMILAIRFWVKLVEKKES